MLVRPGIGTVRWCARVYVPREPYYSGAARIARNTPPTTDTCFHGEMAFACGYELICRLDSHPKNAGEAARPSHLRLSLRASPGRSVATGVPCGSGYRPVLHSRKTYIASMPTVNLSVTTIA